MVESRRWVSGRAAGLWLLAAAGSIALIAALMAPRDDRPSATSPAPGEWRLIAGALHAIDAVPAPPVGGQVAPGRFLAIPGARLARGRTTVSAAPGSQVEVGSGADLPSVTTGRLDIETDQGFLVAGVEVEPLGLVRLALTPAGLTVESGRVRAQGRIFAEGEPIVLGESPGPAVVTETDTSSRETQGEESGALPAGKVLDAASGAGIGGVSVRAVFFHGADLAQANADDTAVPQAGFDAASGAPGAASLPPLHLEMTETEPDGTFSLPPVFADDPRVAVYIEASHPAYATASTVLSSRADLRGRWAEAEIRMRRGLTVRVEVTGPDGAPIAGAPVRVTGRSSGYSFLHDESVTRALDGRLVKLDAPRLRFTGEDGSFRVPFSDHAYDFELLHPGFYLYHRSLSFEMTDRVTLVVPLEGPLRLAALPRWTERHLVLDSDGVPATNAEIELVLDGMPPLRVLTDESGWLVAGITPWANLGEPLSFRHPRVGTLTVLTPELFKRSAAVAFPSLESDVSVNGRRAGRLRLRCVTDDELSAVPVPAEGIALSLDMTLVERNEAGEAEFSGPLPGPGSFEDLFLTGFLPARVVIPAHGHARDSLDVDLGDVPFSRGLSRNVVFTGAGRDALRGATLLVSVPGGPSGPPTFQHRYRVGEDGHVLVSGLTQGAWAFGVEGPRLKSSSGVFAIDEVEEAQPLEIPVDLSGEEDIVVTGRVVELTPLEAARCEVVERYLIAGDLTPRSFPPYAPSPDGMLGSARRLRGVLGVEVTVISPGDAASHVAIGRGAELTAMPAGELRLRPETRAEIAFQVDGLGRVLPPRNASLEGEAGIESLARLGVRNRKLLVNDVRPGNYTLKWLGEGGAEETFGFNVPREHAAKVEGVAVRSAHSEESVAVRVADSRGASIEKATVRPRPAEVDLEPPEPGTVLAAVAPRKPSGFTVSAEGYLSASVEVEPGGTVPNEVVLYRGARARGRIVDADSREIDGPISISWEPLTPSPIRHGEPGLVDVKRGLLDVSGLPPLPLLFTLHLVGADLAIRREWTLPEAPGLLSDRDDAPFDLGTLRFEETRRLAGTVLLPDGSPAPGAVVGLVPHERARRFPLNDGGIDHALYTAKANAADAGFVFDGLPVSFERPLTLVAHLHGYEDAVEDPLDLRAEHHVLLLGEEARLSIDAGYADGDVRAAYGFWLEYIADRADGGSRIELGEVAPQLRGGERYVGIEPGIYRLKWGLRERYEPLPALWEEAEVLSGTDSRIALRIEGRELRGLVELNGKPVERGWILLTDDPGANGSTRVGRVLDGRFILIDPPDALHAYAAVVPERAPQPVQNIPRGEALPISVRGYRLALRDGVSHLEYDAHTITLRFENDFLVRHQGAVLSIDYQRWDRTHFTAYPAEELIEAPTIRLELLRPGPHRIAVRSAKDTLIYARTVDLKEDTTLEIR